MKKNSKINKEDILHLAKLANLQLSESEIDKFQKQLSEIVDYFRKLNSVDTEGIEPIAQLTDLVNAYRDDKYSRQREISQEQAIKNARSKKSGLFKVKAIF